MSAPSYGSRWPTYAQQWDHANQTRHSEAMSIATKIFANKARYQAVEAKTGVPWYWIGPTHSRESDLDWHASLAQGDPWNRVSTHVPAGRGPFASWEAAAMDALHLDGLDKVQDWRLEKLIYYWEVFNGWGYYAHGVPSPYVWSGTSIQHPGKYVSDGVWSSTAIDSQLGTVAILKCLMELDPTIKPQRETTLEQDAAAAPAPIPPPKPVVAPVVPPKSSPVATTALGGAAAATVAATIGTAGGWLDAHHVQIILIASVACLATGLGLLWKDGKL